jgi:deoxyribose-phosphate aldolase
MTSRSELARLVDHTLLKVEATPADVVALCSEAAELGVFSICISPSFLPLAGGWLDPAVKLATVCGFPSGKHHRAVKAFEAGQAVSDGADEVDMVIDVGLAKAGDWAALKADIESVRTATDGALLKVIIESAALTDEEIVAACKISAEVGADFVKTSTGFHPSGGASTHAVELMRATVGDALGVKASGGIRTAESALAMVAAGASRLGLSGTAAVLDGLEGKAAPANSGAGGY